ncbi:hypothetical protein GALMADRAFT_68267 [Galerina marginata CBS 339.88]|uniref:Ribosomal RNA-processing protein 17 n=1 Tax=Galerina marginata (strain CBS 339.88) TaxID=685588 RepID=A0A067T784_GALM3|nr:hypothetical protein GALMADRAFT_68267 [Galerina marginata CBS 339.88]
MSTSNIALLTRSHNVVAAKKRAKKEQVKEVLFDEHARRDFLTGFHKRKLAKAEAARSKAKEREKQERLETRREQRRMLREQALENAAQVEKAYGAVIGPSYDEDWNGIDTSHQDGNERDDEYEDEEMLATVTVIEDFDPDTIIHGPTKSEMPNATSAERPEAKPSQPPSKKALHGSAKNIKTKDKKVRYETKDARRREQTKQRVRRTEKAELAGGKAARKSKSPGGKRKHGSKR